MYALTIRGSFIDTLIRLDRRDDRCNCRQDNGKE
jgi:hypothetical protein